MFDNLSERLERSFKILKGEGKITEINVAETLKDVRKALLDADVNKISEALARCVVEIYATVYRSMAFARLVLLTAKRREIEVIEIRAEFTYTRCWRFSLRRKQVGIITYTENHYPAEFAHHNNIGPIGADFRMEKHLVTKIEIGLEKA